MTRAEFNRLPYRKKRLLVFSEGTYLATRMCTGYWADLFYLPGDYYVECFYHTGTRQLISMCSLISKYGYGPYLENIHLPADLFAEE